MNTTNVTHQAKPWEKCVNEVFEALNLYDGEREKGLVKREKAKQKLSPRGDNRGVKNVN